MDDPHDRLFQLAREGPENWSAEIAESRRRWLRRMLTLLGTACLAFCLTALWLSRPLAQSSVQDADSQAENVVRAHFAALHRGDFRTAYALFSTRLRRRMPFAEFHEIMMDHMALLRGQVRIYPQSTTAGRVVVDIDFPGTRHFDLTAEFTLIQTAGRWWIDDMQWDMERKQQQHLLFT